jgi:hypothetical protein
MTLTEAKRHLTHARDAGVVLGEVPAPPPASATSVRFGTVDALLAFLDHDIRPARTRIIETLSDPALTGNEPRSAAPSGSRLDRQPMLSDSAISDAVAPANPAPAAACSPRRSATANARPAHRLNRRKLCTLDVLADLLGDVSRASIGNVIRETRPLLHQDGHPRPGADGDGLSGAEDQVVRLLKSWTGRYHLPGLALVNVNVPDKKSTRQVDASRTACS